MEKRIYSKTSPLYHLATEYGSLVKGVPTDICEVTLQVLKGFFVCLFLVGILSGCCWLLLDAIIWGAVWATTNFVMPDVPAVTGMILVALVLISQAVEAIKDALDERKKAKPEDLAKDIKNSWWNKVCFPVEFK